MPMHIDETEEAPRISQQRRGPLMSHIEWLLGSSEPCTQEAALMEVIGRLRVQDRAIRELAEGMDRLENGVRELTRILGSLARS